MTTINIVFIWAMAFVLGAFGYGIARCAEVLWHAAMEERDQKVIAQWIKDSHERMD